jgi:hypothetical protein
LHSKSSERDNGHEVDGKPAALSIPAEYFLNVAFEFSLG